jgi:hypothetical protein
MRKAGLVVLVLVAVAVAGAPAMARNTRRGGGTARPDAAVRHAACRG